MINRFLGIAAVLIMTSLADNSRISADETAISEAAETTMTSKDKIAFDLYDSGYFVLNTITPCRGKDYKTGCFDSSASFAGTFGIARVMGTGQRFLPDDYFDGHFVLNYTEWGKTPWDYDVRGIWRNGKTLVVKITKTGEESPTATFAVPLILGVSRADCHGIETVLFDFIPADAPDDTVGTVVPLDLHPAESFSKDHE